MFIRAKEAFETPGFNIAKGQLVEIPDEQAAAAIAAGAAESVETETAIQEITKIEQATSARQPPVPRGAKIREDNIRTRESDPFVGDNPRS